MAFFDTTWYVNFGNGSSTGYYAVPVWPGALSAVTAGTWCRQLTTPAVGNERCFVALTSGITGAAEPVWVVTRGADTGADIDGTVTWQECTGVAATCGDLTNAVVWATVKNKSVTLGEVIYDSVSASVQICSTAGTAGNASQPSFSATAGVTTSDNTITWTSLGLASAFTAWKYPHNRVGNAIANNWAAAGNTVFLSNNSAETQATSITYTSLGAANSPISVVCVNDSVAPPVSLATTGSVNTTGTAAIQFGSVAGAPVTTVLSFYGVNFNAGSSASAGNITINGAGSGGAGGSQAFFYDTCMFKLNNTATTARININTLLTGGSQYSVYCTGCTFIFGSVSQEILLGAQFSKFIGCTFAPSGTVPTTLMNTSSGSGEHLFRDCDFSAITGTVTVLSSNNGIRFENSKLGAAVVIASGAGAGWNAGYVKAHNCDSTSTNYRYFFANFSGKAQQETTIVRTGSSATDGTTPVSWNLTSTANSGYLVPFFTEEVAQWNDLTGSLRTATMYLNTNSTLTNSNFWAEIEYLGATGSPIGSFVNSRMTLLSSPSALSSDTSVWGGALTKQYSIALTFTPQMKGPVKLRFYLATPSITVYVDPYIYIT